LARRMFALIWLCLVLSALHTLGGAMEACAAQPEPDIQWFREQMQIDPKYLEQEEGIFGISWFHFLTMMFLLLFFFMGLLAHFARIRKRKQILIALLTERLKESERQRQ
jgi:hypothetical protein